MIRSTLTAEVAGNGTVQKTDHQHDQTGEQTHQQRNPRAEHHADEVVAAELVGAENVGEDVFTVFDGLLLVFGIFEGSQILGGLVPLAVHGDHLGVAVGVNGGHDDDRQRQDDENDQTGHGQRVLHQLAHTVPEKGGGFAHGLVLLLFFIRGGGEFLQIDLQAQKVLSGQHIVLEFMVHGAFLLNPV